MNFINVLNGWKNYITDNKEIEELAKKRALICVECPSKKDSTLFGWVKDEIKEISATVCKECDCPIAMKVRSKKEKCPLNKW